MNSTARDDLPDEPVELAKLARQLGYAGGDALLADCREATHATRELFDATFAVAAAVG